MLLHNRGGSIGTGLTCDPRPNPPLQYNGPCPEGWIQCKQPIGCNALAVAAAATAQIVVTPRRGATPRQFIVAAQPALDFTVDVIQVDGTILNIGNLMAEAWSAGANGVDYSVDWPPFDANTPLLMDVTNISGGMADFRAVLICSVNRMA